MGSSRKSARTNLAKLLERKSILFLLKKCGPMNMELLSMVISETLQEPLIEICGKAKKLELRHNLEEEKLTTICNLPL